MRFFNARRLAGELRADALPEAVKLRYLIALSLLTALAPRAGLISGLRHPVELLRAVLYVAVIVGG
jgi:hypothetical protein